MELFGRNDLCWCKSGLKYKKCHLAFDQKIESYRRRGCIVPTRSIIKTPEQIEKIRESAKIKTAITSSLNRKENRDDSKRIKTGTHNSGESRIDGKGTPQNPF